MKWELTKVCKIPVTSDKCLLTISHLKLVLQRGKNTQLAEQDASLQNTINDKNGTKKGTWEQGRRNGRA